LATNKETFDRIAESWYGFRHWPLLGEELSEVAVRWQCGRLLNLGCAHGPDFLPFVDGFELYGVDFSARMLTMARQYMKRHGFHAEVVQADLTALPFDQGSFDYAVSIAALHHIDEQSARLGAIRAAGQDGAVAPRQRNPVPNISPVHTCGVDILPHRNRLRGPVAGMRGATLGPR